MNCFFSRTNKKHTEAKLNKLLSRWNILAKTVYMENNYSISVRFYNVDVRSHLGGINSFDLFFESEAPNSAGMLLR